jgi:hypothetical protein
MRWIATTGVLLAVSCSNVALSLERLDRGVVAISTPEGHTYIGWRLLASDAPDLGFDVLRCTASDGAY